MHRGTGGGPHLHTALWEMQRQRTVVWTLVSHVIDRPAEYYKQSDPNTIEKFKKLLSIMNLILYIIYELVTTKDHQSWQFKSMVLVGSMIIFYTASVRRVHDNIANDKMKT